MTQLEQLLKRSLEGGRQKSVERGPVGPAKKALVQITLSGGELLKNLERKTSDFRTPFRRIVRAGRALIVEEFERESFRTPSNSFRAWPKTKPFGNRGPPKRTLHRSGALERAWGGGPGSVTRVTSKGATWGISAPDYAPFVRSGANIRVTQKQRFFLGINFGVWLKKSTRTLVIPPRRHAELGKNRAYAEDAGYVIASWMSGATRSQIDSASGRVIR